VDAQINVNRLSKALYRRGIHRILGNPFLGTFTAFLIVLFLIRIAANLYLAINLANMGSRIDAVQIAGAHFIYLSAYAIWVGSLASLRISLALPRLCFVNFAPGGKQFRSRFRRQIAFRRPLNIVALSIILFTAIVFSLLLGNWHVVVVQALVVLSSTFIGIFIVLAVASWSFQSRSEIQIMEMLYLIFLVALNPDIGPFNNRVSIFFRGFHFPFHSVWEIGFAVGLIVLLALLILVLVRMMSAMGKIFRKKLSLSPIERWYWRFLRIRSWVLLYLVILPVLISTNTTPGAKRWAMVLSILFGAVSYLYFIAQCENTLHEKWRCSLFDKGNIRIITRSVLVHIVLMTIPVLGYVAAK